MGDSTEKNLKSYMNSELKWFLLANILLMLVTSGELKFDSQDANVFSFISEIISITAVSSCAYILTFIFDSILPPIFKVIIDNLPKGIDQTPYWYSIYERNRSNPIVFGSNRDYLLLRDMHAQMVMLMVVYVALVLVTGLMDFSEPFIFYILFMIGALNVGARVQGKRVVYNVLSVDINAKKDE